MKLGSIPILADIAEFKNNLELKILPWTFFASDRKAFYRRLANQMRSKFIDGTETTSKTPKAALIALEENYSDGGLKPNAPKAMMCRELVRRMDEGLNLSDALEGFIPASERAIIGAGITSTKIVSSLNACIVQIDKSAAIVKPVFQINQAALTVCILLYILIQFSNDVIPSLEESIPKQAMPPSGVYLVEGAKIVREYAVATISLFFFLIGISLVSLPYLTGWLRNHLDGMPIFSQYRIVVGGRLMVAFGTMIEAGLTQKEAITKLRDISNSYVRERLDIALAGMREGTSFAKSLMDQRIFFPSKDILRDLSSGAEGSEISQATSGWLDITAQEMDQKFAFLNVLLMAISTGVILGVNFAIVNITMSFKNFASAGI